MNSLAKQAGAYRAHRRNAARQAGTLKNWRHRQRMRTGVYGVRSERYIDGVNQDGTPIFKIKTWRVYTYVVAAA